MKRLFAIILATALVLSCLVGCNLLQSDKNVTCEKFENSAVFKFDDFDGSYSVELSRSGLGEGAIYYWVNIEHGRLTVNYKDTGLVGTEHKLDEFFADGSTLMLSSSSGYVEGDRIEISFNALSSVKGEIVIAFTKDALETATEKLHKHTGNWLASEGSHYYQYTCGCPSPDIAELHIDYDENLICDICAYVMEGHEHSYNYSHDEFGHGWSYTCGCMTPPNFAQHFDGNGDGQCDGCEYIIPAVSQNVAEILLDYERSLMDELTELQTEHPENIYYYQSVDELQCTLVLKSNASADSIVAKYDMNNAFANARVSALNAIKMISINFKRNDFTEQMHQAVKQISESEELVERLFVDMYTEWYRRYMPKIEYYTDDARVLSYTATNAINLLGGKDVIIKTKAEYDAYLDGLLEIAEDYQKEMITDARDLYTDSFFEENALIITKVITRGSTSINLTVNNLYRSGDKVYVVVRTDVPSVGDEAMQYTHFGFAVNKTDVEGVSEVITLE